MATTGYADAALLEHGVHSLELVAMGFLLRSALDCRWAWCTTRC
jgi:hypothetical protein